MAAFKIGSTIISELVASIFGNKFFDLTYNRIKNGKNTLKKDQIPDSDSSKNFSFFTSVSTICSAGSSFWFLLLLLLLLRRIFSEYYNFDQFPHSSSN
jgi:hypothetical protein